MVSLFFFRICVFPGLLLGFLYSPIVAQNISPLQIIPNKKNYTTGDQIFFRTQLPKNGYVYLLNLKADGSLHLLFPNDEDENNQLRIGYQRLPSKNSEYEWVIDSAGGEEIFYFILSDKMIKYFHKKSILRDQAISTDNWLRRHTSNLLPWEWQITEIKIRVKQ